MPARHPIQTIAARLSAGLCGAVALLAGAALLAPPSALANPRRDRALEASETALEGAGARPARKAEAQSARGGPCTVTLALAATQLTAGEEASLSGTLSCPLAEEAVEQTVTVYEHAVGIPGFAAAGTAATGAGGAFQLHTEALETNGVLYATAAGARSSRIHVGLAAHVTLEGPPPASQLLIAGRRAGAGAPATNTVTFKGTVTPAVAGMRVVLQRESQGRWRPIGLGEVGADGSYSIAHTFRGAGKATVRVLIHQHGKAASASGPLSYAISKRQRTSGAGDRPAPAARAPAAPPAP